MNAMPQKGAVPNDLWPNVISISLILTLLKLEFHFTAWRSFGFTLSIGLFYAVTMIYCAVAGRAALSDRVMHWLGVAVGFALFAIASATRSGHTPNAIYFFSKKAMSLPSAIDSAAWIFVSFHFTQLVIYGFAKMYRVIKTRFRGKP